MLGCLLRERRFLDKYPCVKINSAIIINLQTHGNRGTITICSHFLPTIEVNENRKKEEKEQNEANKTTKAMQKDLYILKQPFEDTTNMKRGENETMDR